LAKPITEDHRSIDIRDWARNGVLLQQGTRELCWVNDGTTVFSIRVEIQATRVETQANRVVLRYHVLGPGGQWDPIDEGILFARTKGGPGWERIWFLCPGCTKRVAILYLKKYYFRCRHCLGLVYQSQKISRSQRALMRSAEIVL
jgi:hypothetical protein